MKKQFSKTSKYLYVISLLLLIASCNSNNSIGQKGSLKIELSEQTYKPWAYWWWMGSSVTKDGIIKNLEEYAKAGMGGLHIIPIYGEKGDEENFIEYLSPQWMEMLAHTVNEARKLGLGIDMTTGTGWPFGGPKIHFEHSAKTFRLLEIDLDTVNNINELTKDIEGAKLIHLSAQDKNGKYENITESVQKNGQIQHAGSLHKALALISRPTRQQVKRAAPGAKGLVMDYFNQNALNAYFNKFQLAFNSTQFPSGKVRAFYNDSYEVYGANFTTNFLEKFKELRSYDLANYLHVIADTTSTETKERIVTDYCETISDLLLSEFTIPWVKKSHEMGMVTRNQAHGSPGNLLDLYGAADIPETESFGVSDFSIPGLKKDPDFEEERFGRPSPFTMKFASSAAHIKNKKLVASETATWLGDHFKVALSQVKPQIDELFTGGINHIVYHGITYNPPEKPFPGRLFYASTNFGTKSHFWNELPALNKYIERCQKVLQNSKPYNDVLVYFPIHDIWAKKYTDELIIRLEVHHSENWLEETHFGDIVAKLWGDGFTFDYVSDKMLSEAVVEDSEIRFEGGAYKTILVPQCTYMPEGTLENLNRLAKAGANIIFQENIPESVSGFNNLKERQEKFNSLKTQIKPITKTTTDIPFELLKSGILNEEMATQGLSFIRKKADDGVVYFISNLGNKFKKGQVSLSIEAKQVEIFDPITGKKGVTNSKIVDGKTFLNLHLEPGQSLILKCLDSELIEQKWTDYKNESHAITIDSEWTIKPIGKRNNLPNVVNTKNLRSWTELGNVWPVYSGKAVYSCEFEIDEIYIGQEMLIDLGDVRETARIKINGVDIGLLWCIPYKTIIPKDILKKSNKIEIEVTNLSFNQVIELDRKGVQWKNFHEINFINIKYEPYNASDKEPVKSGLLSEIKLYPIAMNTENELK
jgi:hypothetical protein